MNKYLVKSNQIDHYDAHLTENADIIVIKLDKDEIVLNKAQALAIYEELKHIWIMREPVEHYEAIQEFLKEVTNRFNL